jgi:hypothetical protein
LGIDRRSATATPTAALARLWMIADRSDPELNVKLYLPKAHALRDISIVSLPDSLERRLARR